MKKSPFYSMVFTGLLFLTNCIDTIMMTRLKYAMLLLSLAYLTFYLPVMTVAYSPFWYKLSCGFHGRCAMVGEEKAMQGIDELVSYYRHTCNELPSSFWTTKEKNHLADVRGMIDTLTVLCAPALLMFVFSFDRGLIRRFSLVNMAMVCSLLLILPFFKYFWRHVFHPLLFSNRNWLNTPLDFSYYILPRVFFQYTVIFVVISAILINLMIYAVLTARNKGLGKK